MSRKKRKSTTTHVEELTSGSIVQVLSNIQEEVQSLSISAQSSVQIEDLEWLSKKFDWWITEVVAKFQSMLEVVKEDIINVVTNRL